MTLLVDDNLNIILTEEAEYLLNGACELDGIEWSNRTFSNHAVPLFQILWMKVNIIFILTN